MPSEDTELLKSAQAGDPAAFEGLVQRHRSRVFGLARRMLGSDDDAAEVLQDTFLSAYWSLGNFRGEGQFGSWVYRIAANRALMLLRQRKLRKEIDGSTPEGPTFNERGSLLDEVADFRDAEGQAMDRELRQAIENAAENLAPEYREVFVLRDLEGLSYEEIAEITGSTVPAIKSRLHRARLSMRESIDHFYAERSS